MPIFGHGLLWLFLFFLPSGSGIFRNTGKVHAMQYRCENTFPVFYFAYLPITA